jgi:hypothetical protein
MKKLLIGIAALTCLVGFTMSGCSYGPYTYGSGPIVQKGFVFKDFNKLEISSNFRYEISQSADYSVNVSTHQNISEYLDVYQTSNTVYIKLEGSRGYNNTDAKVTITMPELNSVKVSGASRGTINGFESTKPLEVRLSGASQMDLQVISGQTNIEVSGASKMTGYIKAQDTDLKVSGASNCTLQGSATKTNVDISGASTVSIGDLVAQAADVSVHGASRATVNTDGDLSLHVSGASTVHYLGQPEITRMDVSGASHVSRQ